MLIDFVEFKHGLCYFSKILSEKKEGPLSHVVVMKPIKCMMDMQKLPIDYNFHKIYIFLYDVMT